MKYTISRLFRPRHKRWDTAILGVAIIIFTAISIGNMTRWSVWFDEAFGVYMLRYNPLGIAGFTATDVHPPMYYWVLQAWTAIWGTSEFALRSLSLLMMLIAFVFIYLMVRRAFDTKITAVAIGLLAISPMLVRYSEEARMYGLVMAIVAAATFVFVRAMESPTKRKWYVYGVLVSLGMWTHYFTALVWLTHWALRAYLLKTKNKRVARGRFWDRQWVLAHVLAVGLYLPWLPFMVRQVTNVQGGGFWIPPVSADTPANFLSTVLLFRASTEVKNLLALGVFIVAVLAIIGVLRARTLLDDRQRLVFDVTCFVAFMPAVLLLVLSMPPLRPIFYDRYIIPSAGYIIVLIGLTVGVLLFGKVKASRWLGGALGALMVVLMIVGVAHVYAVGNYNTTTNDPLPIRPTLREAQSLASPGEPFVVGAFWRYYETHYYQTDRNPVYFIAEDNLTWGSYDMVRYDSYHKVYDIAAFAKAHGGKIWFVDDWSIYGKPKMPKKGTWHVIQEVKVPGIPEDQATIRAVELQLVN